MPHALHAQTPSLQAVDGRGLVVRHVHYHRAQVGDSAQARVEKRCYDPAARPSATWDPRLSARLQDNPATRPNLSSVFSLSGTPLAVESVDAGWQVSLFGEAGHLLENWDGRGSHWLTEYDEFLRPTAVHEQSEGQPVRTSERFSYADCSEHSIANNLCARLIRSDDGAGCEQVQAFAINHQAQQQTRRFLNEMELPDWPEDPTLREALLEPGTGAATHTRYGATGETLSQTDASGNRQAFVYGVCGQIKKISLTPASANEHVLLSDLTYNAFAQLEAQTAGNGVITHALFDPADGRLQELLATRTDTDTDTLQHLLYQYDPVGNVVRIQDRALPTRHFSNQRIEPINHYEHDSLYQLISATGREIAGATIRPELPERVNLPLDTSQLLNYTQHYHYDEAGNLLELKHEGAQFYTRQMIVDLNSNRALAWKEGEAPPDFASQFDANGNLLTLVPGRPMRWDARNHLLEVSALARTEGDNDRERYAYDASGMRLRKCATAQAKSLIHTREVRYLPGLEIRTDSVSGERLEVVTVQAGRAHVRYLHWPDIKPDGISNNQLRYSVDDHLGSSTLELDHEARLISHEGYYPFGGTAWWAARSVIEAKYKVVRYSGKEMDTTGLYYYGLRYYAPWLQRWINPDPANQADGLNPYLMVMNNPITLIDPNGAEGVIPNDASWVWLGKRLPPWFAQNINKFVHENPHYSVTLWTDKTSWAGGHAEALENLSKRVNIRPIEQAFEGMSYKLEAAFERERSGPLKNYAAASDLGRTAIISKAGWYFDTDVLFKEPMPSHLTLKTNEDIVMVMDDVGNLVNSILGAPSNSTAVQSVIKYMTEKYSTEYSWSAKRQFHDRDTMSRLNQEKREIISGLKSALNMELPEERLSYARKQLAVAIARPAAALLRSERIHGTVMLTGPGAWQSVDIKPVPKIYYPLDASGDSIRSRPERLRRASI